ncbi:glutathione S-transferase family protein [Marinomonas balearica]|uniref:Glutathione S-transferase n=1 Tax=Marinomonas balearica TaxID=491947 RepID=A0A4R6MJS6_9GAMM|nr:glutathione S-transferase [Marinomonas balearica]TDP01201.1 glutathione S-transferase [Marinomonas balearica]
MKLLWSPRSPFARKVAIVLHELNLQDETTKVLTNLALPITPPKSILEVNPLGKIPALILENGKVLMDSRVICEYLNSSHNGSLYGTDYEANTTHLIWQSLADGLNETLLLWRTEINRGDTKSTAICANFETKVGATMAHLNTNIQQFRQEKFGIGHIATLCVLGQLDFRWSSSEWRRSFPELAAWAQDVSDRPSVKENPSAVEDSSTAFPIKAPQIQFFKE